MKILIVTDAWHPQVNGVVTTLSNINKELIKAGHQVDIVEPSLFKTIPLIGYSEVDDLESIEGRSNAAKFAIPLVNSINNETLKQAYIEEIASICRLDFAALLSSGIQKPRSIPAADIPPNRQERMNIFLLLGQNLVFLIEKGLIWKRKILQCAH